MVNTNFREFELSSGRKVFAGKNSEQNDFLVKSARKNEVILHTSEPGSPFVNIGGGCSKEEIKEAAVFCALKSQAWRDKKGDILVHSFFKKDCSKGLIKKSGSWQVKKIIEVIKVKKSEINKLEKEMKNGKTD